MSLLDMHHQRLSSNLTKTQTVDVSPSVTRIHKLLTHIAVDKFLRSFNTKLSGGGGRGRSFAVQNKLSQ